VTNIVQTNLDNMTIELVVLEAVTHIFPAKSA